MNKRRGRRWAVITSVAGTVFIAAGAFWLSFTSLADLAHRSGIGAGQAWAWPLIVDGVIVVSTVAVVALAGDRAAWYPWALLIGGAAVSVIANSLHAIVAADSDVPAPLAAAVAAVPPVVLLAITHLTVLLSRAARSIPPQARPLLNEPPSAEEADLVAASAAGDAEDGQDRRARAFALRAQGWSNKAIARQENVHPSTVGRWFSGAHQSDEASPSGSEPAMEGAPR